MKSTIITSIILFIFSVGCSKESTSQTQPLNDTITIQQGKIYSFDEKGIQLKFDAMLNDSRCPINANCITAGNASVQLISSQKGSSKTFVLNTELGLKNDTLINSIRYKLIDLTPYPFVGTTYNQSDYIVKIVIKEE